MATESTTTPYAHIELSSSEVRKVIFASSLGTVFEWYDFYLYGTLASFFGALFFPSNNPTIGLLASLATFAAGFLVRPFGALVFGRLGDLIGRKYTFLVTILIMGISTAGVGFLPTYASIGDAAWIILLALRLAQGLALGGEYGGAATYVAEHAPNNKRGYFTSWIQTTATLGLFLSLAVILVTRIAMSPDDFKQWGWRIPFILSIGLLLISVYIRMKLSESPIFKSMKAEGKTSKNPLKESFLHAENLKYVLLALFGAVAGQGVVWYTGQFYALFFLQNTMKVDFKDAYILIAISLALATPFFVFFGWLSDKIGRKWIILAGCLLAIVTYRPLFTALAGAANPTLIEATQSAPVTVFAKDGEECSFGFWATIIPQHSDNDAKKKPCVAAKKLLINSGINYSYGAPLADAPIGMKVKDVEIKGWDEKAWKAALKQAGYPEKADPARVNKPLVVLILFILVIYVTMVYGPIAAFLVELFPTKIRYTSMSLPYHIGNGWFGGFLPFTATWLAIAQGNIYAGLWYPIIVAAMTLVIGAILTKETFKTDIHVH